jgi:hypothetical protein
MKKSILKVMLLGGVIFGASQVQASTIAEEAPVAQAQTMVEDQGPIKCMVEVVIRGEEMAGHYSPETLDKILEMEIEKCFNGTHSSL